MSRRFVVEDRAKLSFSVDREALVSAELLEREQRLIFDRCWIYVGHGSEIREPGSFRTRMVAGRPIIFCRDAAGTVRCFLNSCRHRGATVCIEREGARRYFTCPYHGWTYDGDGSLVAVPGEDAYGPHFDKSAHGLVPVAQLQSYRDFYFLNLDPIARDLDTYLAGAKEYLDLVTEQSPSGRLEIITGTQEYDIRANWKLLVENSVDDYHLPATHSTWLNYMRSAGVTTRPPKDSGLLLRSGQRASHHRQSQFPRSAGRGVDFDLWRGGKGRHRRHPRGAGAAPGRGARRTGCRHQPQSRRVSEPRRQ
jgi:p-cumate 2,3-dioxygenase subunit alpha